MSSFVHILDQRRLIGAGGSTVAGDMYFYYSGTSVLAPVYLDSNLSIPSTNPIVVAAGEIIPLVFLDTGVTYRRVIEYADGTIDEQDPIGVIATEGDLGIPVGTVLDYTGGVLPTGYLFCDGSAISRTTYSDLFSAIGTTHGAGNGTTTFNVPDYRGRVSAGKDNMGGVAANRLVSQITGTTLGATGGVEEHVLTEAEMPSHNHVLTDPGHTHPNGASNTSPPGIIGGSGGSSFNASNSGSATTGITLADTGGDDAHTNVQPTIICNKIIKAVPGSLLSLIDLIPDNKANASAVGIDPSDTDLGTFTGSTILDGSTVKEALQVLETGLEGKVFTSDLASTDADKGASLVAGALKVFRVTDYGADKTGVTTSTAAFQACADDIESEGGGIFFMPPGIFDIDESIFFPSNTIIMGSGRATVVRAATAYVGVNGGTWATETCQLFKNKNYAASSLTDHDIVFQDFHIDWNGVTVSGGGAHSIAIRYAERITIKNVTQEGGENVTALQACTNTLTERCYGHNQVNCAFDHWEGCTDAWVKNCVVEVDPGESCVQGIQFTGTSSHQTNVGHTADCWALNNIIKGIRHASGTAAAFNFNAGADGSSSVRRVRTINNHIKDCDSGWMAVGDSDEHFSINDTFEDVDAVVYGLIADGAPSGPPNNVTIDGATLKDCDHSVSATALLSIAGDGHIVSGLKVINTGAAAYTRLITLTAAATNCKVTVDKAPDGSGGLRFSNSGTNCKIFDVVDDAFLASHSVSQTFNSTSLTDVAFDTETFDDNSSFASNIFTAKVGGTYQFNYSLLHDNTGTAGDRWQITITTTPKTFAKSYKMIADYDSISGSAIVKLSAGQTAKIRIQRVGGSGNFITTTDQNSTWFSGAKIG